MNKTLTESITIRVRLILWYVFTLAVTILGFGIYLQFELQNNLFTQVDAGLQVAAAQLLVDVDDTVNPPALRPLSQTAVENLTQSFFALRLVTQEGEVTAEVGEFPTFPFSPLDGFQTIAADGIHWRLYTQRIVTDAGEFDVSLQMAQSLNTIFEAQNSLTRLILFGIPIVLMVAALVGIFIADRSLRPLNIITRTAQQINATDMTKRIGYVGPADELGRLADTLNSMLNRLQSAFDAERRFTADASHELRTPLTAIKGQISVTLARLRTPEEYAITLIHIQHETDRLIRLTNDLLFLARLDIATLKRQDERLNLTDLLDAVVDQMMSVAEEKQLQFRSDLPESIAIVGIPDHLIRLFLNLLDNAIKFTPSQGVISISSQQAKSEVKITVTDTGPGIAPEHLANIFQRFYRVEADRSSKVGSMGLGLAIAYQIAREHQGRIEVESRLGEGSAFMVYLPAGEQFSR
jgi:heavy metal sensor kinase